MKRCPTCNKTYTDDALSFCPSDGTPLVNDTGSSFDPQATILASPPKVTTPSSPFDQPPANDWGSPAPPPAQSDWGGTPAAAGGYQPGSQPIGAQGSSWAAPPPPPFPGGAPSNIPNYLVPAILATLFCCLPAGVVSIIFATQVNGKAAAGDIEGAMNASKNAKTWLFVSVGLGLLSVIFVIFVNILAAISR